jgi:predicted enzyme related to lactoylglutathione lyase
MPNPVLHFQLSSRQSEATAAFYRQLFDWKMNAVPGMGYHLIETEAKQGIQGGIQEAKAEEPVEITFYVQVQDVQAALDKAQSLGAVITQPKLEVMPELVVGMFKDLEGRNIGVMHDSRLQAEMEAAAEPALKVKAKLKPKPKPVKKAKKAAKKKKAARR